jgi:hypothetical protein
MPRDQRRLRTRALGALAAAELLAAALFALLGGPSGPSGPAADRSHPAAASAAPTTGPPATNGATGASKQGASAQGSSAQGSSAQGGSNQTAPPGSTASTSSTTSGIVTQTGPSSTAPPSTSSPTGAASSAVASAPVTTAPAPTVTTTPAPHVTCETDLPLSQSPDASYNFLCRNGNTPVTWASSRITVYMSGLSAAQNLALPIALAQWEQFGGFQVSFASTAQDAQVVVSGSALGPGQPGYTEDGYTTVSYVCRASKCVYDKAAVVLSSTATLTQTDWISTILHELGHVAGLNHVSQKGEVMYPYLTAGSPAVYASGDKTGLAVLASERTS